MNCIDQMLECYGAKKGAPFTAEKQIELIKYIMEDPNTDELRMYYSEILKCHVFHWYSLPELDMRVLTLHKIQTTILHWLSLSK